MNKEILLNSIHFLLVYAYKSAYYSPVKFELHRPEVRYLVYTGERGKTLVRFSSEEDLVKGLDSLSRLELEELKEIALLVLQICDEYTFSTITSSLGDYL